MISFCVKLVHRGYSGEVYRSLVTPHRTLVTPKGRIRRLVRGKKAEFPSLRPRLAPHRSLVTAGIAV